MISVGHDTRLAADEGSKLAHTGACRRCGRSSLGIYCRTCSKKPDAPLERAPERPRPPAAIADASRVMKVDDQEEKDVPNLEDRTCALTSCGAKFTPGRTTQRFHSPECKNAFFDAEKKAGRYSKEPKSAAASKSEKPARKPAARPASSSTATSSPTTSLPYAGGELPPEVGMLLALAELEPAARSRVLSWARARWGE